MKKIGCSNISIVLTLIGILPLIGSAIALYDIIFHLEYDVKYSQLVTLLFLLIFGLITCSYRNCIYINGSHLQIINTILFYRINNKTYPVNQFDDIYIDISHHDTADLEFRGGPSYSIVFRGKNSSVNISDHLRIKTDVLKKIGWQQVKEFAEYLSDFTKLEINYSDKVKSYNSLN